MIEQFTSVMMKRIKGFVGMYQKEYFSKLFSLSRDLNQLFFREFENSFELPDSLNHTHIKTLMFVKFNQPSPMSTISTQLALEKGSFTTVANRLIAIGYLEKKRDKEDRRVFLLSLTEKGENFTSTFAEKHREHVKKLINLLDHSEQEQYLALVEQLLTLNSKIRETLGLPEHCN